MPEDNKQGGRYIYGRYSESQIVVYSYLNLLFRPQIPFRGLNRRVAEQELDLLQIATTFSTELGAGAAKVMGAEVFDSDLLR